MSFDHLTEDGDVPTLSEPKSRERAAGLIAGMKDDFIITFDYRGMQIVRDGRSIFAINSETGDELGGRLLLESVDIDGAIDWLDRKAKFHGVAE